MKKKAKKYLDCVYDMPEDVCEAFHKCNSDGEPGGNGKLVNWNIDIVNDIDNKNRMKVHDWLMTQGYKDCEQVQIKWWW